MSLLTSTGLQNLKTRCGENQCRDSEKNFQTLMCDLYPLSSQAKPRPQQTVLIRLCWRISRSTQKNTTHLCVETSVPSGTTENNTETSDKHGEKEEDKHLLEHVGCARSKRLSTTSTRSWTPLSRQKPQKRTDDATQTRGGQPERARRKRRNERVRKGSKVRTYKF